MTFELAVTLIGVFVGVSTIINFFTTRHNAARKWGEEQGKYAADMEYIKHGIDDLKESVKSMQTDIRDHERRLTIVEQSTKSVHKRLDEIKAPGLQVFKKPNEYVKPPNP